MKELFTKCYMCETLIALGKVKDKRKKPNTLSRYVYNIHRPYYLCSVKCRKKLKKLIKELHK